ncbi:MAG TPA: acyl carrier protein [Candidatus Competibacteraceae bacterium]|nr:acyl carrier protein [Candidatus Competibacteraceae bacterium]
MERVKTHGKMARRPATLSASPRLIHRQPWLKTGMTTTTTNARTVKSIQEQLILVLNDMIQGWDMDFLEPINAETRLIEDLGFESVDLMQLIVAIEQTFEVRGLPYEQVLMQDGGYVTEITVRQLTAFLHRFIPLHGASPFQPLPSLAS